MYEKVFAQEQEQNSGLASDKQVVVLMIRQKQQMCVSSFNICTGIFIPCSTSVLVSYLTACTSK